MTTIHDLLLELTSFLTVTQELRDLTLQSDINSNNSEEFRDLLGNWYAGYYDESPELLLQALKRLL